ncbi:MAG: transposase [Bryobacteraceae bacterium]
MGSFDKLFGHMETDETFIGGKAPSMHIRKGERRITGTDGKDKAAVLGILERGGKIRTMGAPSTRKKALQAEVNAHVEAGWALYTDALKSYEGSIDGTCVSVEPFHLFRHIDEQAVPLQASQTNRWRTLQLGRIQYRGPSRRLRGTDRRSERGTVKTSVSQAIGGKP